MANGNGFVQRAPLPPLNSPTITEADRARVYGVIGNELNNILNGPTAHYADSVKKSSRDLMSELDNFIGTVESLKGAMNDPGNIVGDVVRDLNDFRDAFAKGVGNDVEAMWNNPKDGRDQAIKLPDSLAPTTEDHNIIYVDPEPDPNFPAPNPVAPGQSLERRASMGLQGDMVASAGAAARKPVRYLGRFIAGSLQGQPFDTTAPSPSVNSD
jgi:hypothetical protein